MMRPRLIPTFLFAMALTFSGGSLYALALHRRPATHLTRARILSAIGHAVHYLRSKCKPGRFWEVVSPGGWESDGCTALATYALLQAGMATGDARLSPDSSFLHPAIKYLIKLHARGTYVAALQLAALTSEPISARGYRQAIRRAADFLIDSEHKNGAYDYFWNGKKPHEAIPSRWDNSNTQYGVLGVWTAEAGGYIYPPFSYWRMAEKHWRKCQNPDGGWCYQTRGTSTRSMTAAGLATLYIVDQYLHPNLLEVHRPNSALQRGLAWLSKHVETQGNLYYLYGLERVGLASGLRFIGGHNWYRMGARIILKQQTKPGKWTSGVVGASSNVIPTAYALLFLSRGLNPVVFNKLSYPGFWNLRSHDVQNITTWIGDALEENLNWSVVDIHTNAHHWLNAPVLLITGDTAINFNTRQIARLRWYVQHGGMIFSVCENGSTAFNQSMIRTADRLFSGRTMQTLPTTSPIYNIQYNVNPRQFPLEGLGNGARLLWVNCPADLSAAWQTMETVTEAADFQLAENIDLYATGEKKPTAHLHFSHPWRFKKPMYELSAAFMRLAGKRSTARRPNRADVQSLIRFSLRHGIRIIYTRHAHADFPNPAGVPVTYLIVHTADRFAHQTRQAIAHYVRHGGHLIVENYLGTTGGAKELRELFAQIFPSHPLRRLPRRALIAAPPPEIPLRHIKYNSFYLRYHRPSRRLPIWVMQFHHQTAVTVIDVNLSGQWVDNNYWGINAMATPAARRAGLDLLVSAAQETKGGLRELEPAGKLVLKQHEPVIKTGVAAQPTSPPRKVTPLPPTISLQ